MTSPIQQARIEPEVDTVRDLDALFGEAVKPSRIDPLESSIRPRSLRQLDDSSAILLRQFMKVTEEGLGVTQFVYCELPILWVVDRDGAVWFSIEEIVRQDTQEFVLPRLRNARVADDHQRLGHPALIGGGEGRIGGEILFDVGDNPPTWYITNSSGRYGLCKGRHRDHLIKASQLFAKYNINFKTDFYVIGHTPQVRQRPERAA